MKRHPSLFVLCLLLIAGALPFSALAEGNCPPGMYPIGGQGVQGCAPIPAGGGGRGGGAEAERQMDQNMGRNLLLGESWDSWGSRWNADQI